MWTATIKAVQSMKAPTVLLLGGYDKHTDFMPPVPGDHRLRTHRRRGGDGRDRAPDSASSWEEAGYDRITQAYSLRDAVDKGARAGRLRRQCAAFARVCQF